MKRITSLILSAALLPAFAFATVDEACGAYTNYSNNSISGGTHTHVDDGRVLIRTINTGATGNPDSITVEAKDGYEVVSIKLELDDNNTAGWDVETSGDKTNFNPTGSDIEQYEVVVQKVCPDPEPEPTPEPKPTPTPSSPAPKLVGGGGYIKCSMWTGFDVSAEHRCMNEQGQFVKTLEWRGGVPVGMGYFAALEALKVQLLQALLALDLLKSGQ